MERQRLESREARTADSEMLGAAVASKAVIDNAVRVAVDKAQREVGSETFTCYMCGKLKKRDDFYSSTDMKCLTGVTRICKACARKIAHRAWDDDIEKDPTVESMYEALGYLDMRWDYGIYQSVLQEPEVIDGIESVWLAYIRSLLWKHPAARFTDSDSISTAATINAEASKGRDVLQEEYSYNKRDCIRMIGYDPFENYPVEADKPQLYAQLISFIDDETRNDGMKLAAVIQIVKKLNQVEKINDQIDLQVNSSDAAQKMSLLEKMSSSSQKMMQVVNSLAKDNGISVNFNNNKSAGAATLSGKMKKLSEIGFRNAKINTFDIGTCEGMRQVAEISEEARHKRLGYDENIAMEIKDIKVELVEQAIKERDQMRETARRLLLENKDLKDFLKAKGLMTEDGEVLDE